MDGVVLAEPLPAAVVKDKCKEKENGNGYFDALHANGDHGMDTAYTITNGNGTPLPQRTTTLPYLPTLREEDSSSPSANGAPHLPPLVVHTTKNPSADGDETSDHRIQSPTNGDSISTAVILPTPAAAVPVVPTLTHVDRDRGKRPTTRLLSHFKSFGHDGMGDGEKAHSFRFLRGRGSDAGNGNGKENGRSEGEGEGESPAPTDSVSIGCEGEPDGQNAGVGVSPRFARRSTMNDLNVPLGLGSSDAPSTTTNPGLGTRSSSFFHRPRLGSITTAGSDNGTGNGPRHPKWTKALSAMKIKKKSKPKKEDKDAQKSTELIGELMAVAPAALLLASAMRRDDDRAPRIPILLSQLKLRVVDSANLSARQHASFRIEMEYGGGRMAWSVTREFRDFAALHGRYRLKELQDKGKGKKGAWKLPRFPRDTIPYLRGARGISNHEEGDAAEEHLDPDLAAGILAGIGRLGAVSGISVANVKKETFAVAQRKKLEEYLHGLIRILMFRPEANRLLKFLEISALGIRLAAEGTYHGKEGYLVIRGGKGSNGASRFNPVEIRKRHKPKWFLVRHSYIVCVDHPAEMNIYDVFLVDGEFGVTTHGKKGVNVNVHSAGTGTGKPHSRPQHHGLRIKNAERELKLLGQNERTIAQFYESIETIRKATPWSELNRFDSFAPIRTNVAAQWLVDGRDYFWNVSRAILKAKDVIYIHDWWLSPELYMRRPAATSQKWRLDRLLQRKAQEGVKIFVIIYHNVGTTVPIDSQYTKYSLLDLHPNIFVQRSPSHLRQNTFFWAHHEKICVVDHTIGFVGGLDLCFGRWDTPQHILTDDKPLGFDEAERGESVDDPQIWPGKDYSNPRVQDFHDLDKPYEELYDRSQIPRMPWHDISMQLLGQPARDLTRHFVQRWNYLLRHKKPSRPTPFLLPPPDFGKEELEELGLTGTCEVQILRSAGSWSLGTPDKTEHSIQNAYLKCIEKSEHFVYIENQFFITSTDVDGEMIENSIGDALVERIIRAYRNDEHWRCVCVIPLMPGFQNTVDAADGSSVRLIMHCQYRSICRGSNSIFGRLAAEGIDPEDYITFFGLRGWGEVGPNNTLVTEQIYIHAKTMVVDDRVVIIGSANINERSMRGNRDSEVAAVVRDTDLQESMMGGKPYLVGRFAHSLRMRLMREHLGVDVDAIEQEERQMDGLDKKATWQDVDEWHPDREEGIGGKGALDLQSNPDDALSDVLSERTGHSFNHDADELEGPENITSGKPKSGDARVTNNADHKRSVAGATEHEAAEHERKQKKGMYGGPQARDFKNSGDSAFDPANVEHVKLVEENDKIVDATLEPVTVAEYGSVQTDGVQLAGGIPGVMEGSSKPRTSLEKAEARRNSVDRSGDGKGSVTQRAGRNRLPNISITIPDPEPKPKADKERLSPPEHKSHSRNTSWESRGSGTRIDTPPIHVSTVTGRTIPIINPHKFHDPLADEFFLDVWSASALNNTEIFRRVFRPMPDDNVQTWKQYKLYSAYQERLATAQGASEGKMKAQEEAPGHSGPVGGLGQEKLTEKHLGGGKGSGAGFGSPKSAGSRHGRFDDDPEGKSPKEWGERLGDEALRSPVPIGEDGHGGPASGHQRVRSQDLNGVSRSGSQSHRGRRRAGTLRRSDLGWTTEDLSDRESMKKMLGELRGHLVQWPTQWLIKEDEAGNWLYPVDRLPPLEIYD
ncbi:Phospholipase D1 [Saitoella coloradoensis]